MSSHDYMQTTADNWRINRQGSSLTASLCHPRAGGCSCRQQIPVASVSGLMWQQFYTCLPKRQLSFDPSTSFLCFSSCSWGSSPVLPGAAQVWNKRWSLPARTYF